MRIDFTIRDHYGACRDLAVNGPPGSVFGDVRAGLVELMGTDSATDLWSGTRRLSDTTPLGAPGLGCGDVVTIGAPAVDDPAVAAVLQLHVVGGPDAGRFVALPRGLLTVGRAADCDLVLTDADVSRRHACLTVTAGGTTVRDLSSTNGTSIDGVPVDEDGTVLGPGGVLRVGESFLSIARLDEPAAALRTTAGGALLVNRPPRTARAMGAHEIEFPVRGTGRRAQRTQWIAALLPALGGVVLALALHSPQFLAFALLSPLMIAATSLSDRLHWRGNHRRDTISWRRRETAAAAEATMALRSETQRRRHEYPDPALVRQFACAPSTRLWERRRSDADALTVRLGLTDLPSSVQARRGTAAGPAGHLRDVPLTVDLRAGPLGIAAPLGIGAGIARWLVGQLAVLHSPADLEVALLLSEGADAQWAWARWLPHLKRPAATTPPDRQALVADLALVVEQRSARSLDPVGWTGPCVLVVVDRAAELSEQPGLSELLTAGPAVGVTAICVDAQGRRLPSACVTSAVATGETGARVETSWRARAERVSAVADQVTADWADSVARALAPLDDAGDCSGNALPAQCRLLDVLGGDALDVTDLQQRWAASDAGAGTVLGLGVDGVVEVDLVRDGPHALVAGTTGAGKSELLQSVVAGLAVNYPPDAVSFVLIDYKGGAAFADCARLPHTVGLVTDLDGQSTERALLSLQYELSRREALFAQVGAVDLTGYRAVAPTGATLARLVLVVDEFAALAEELPDFVTGLIAIAQRGRSLGIHLVLATQRPGGVVSPEIRANTALRIALRMSDAAESYDVIGSERAAQLGHEAPGRAIVRIGTSLLDVQSARVGGPAGVGSNRQVSVVPLGAWRTAPNSPMPGSGSTTDLRLLADALRCAAAAEGRAAPNRPWLPPLPAQLTTAELPASTARTSIAVGLVDRPDRQQQLPLQLDLAAGGSVLFTGGPRSGRTTALMTIALVAARQLDCDELAIYAVDCAGGALMAIADLPQCGTAVQRERFELIDALLRRLEAAVQRRQTWLADLGISSVADARAEGHRLPLMLCLLDGWDGFVAIADEYDGGRAVEIFVRLLRTGPSSGLTVALAGDRTTLSARLASAVSEKLVLGLAERSDFAMAGIPARRVPRHMPPGRAIRAADAAEVQIASVGGSASGAGAGFAVAETRPRLPGRERPVAINEFAPIRLRPLPVRISLSNLPATLGRFTIGVGGDGADALSIDLFAGAARLLVAGPPRSGRSTALCTLLDQAIRDDIAIVLAARQRTPLARTAAARGIAVLAPDSPADGAALPTRHRRLLLIDDSEAFLDGPLGAALTAAVRSTPENLAVVVTANSDELALTYRGVAAEVRRARCALVLQPGPGDSELAGRRLPQRRGSSIPGRGLLVADAAWADWPTTEPVAVQVALP